MAVIDILDIKKNADGAYERVRLRFGPHYFFDVQNVDGKLTVYLGATHHGFKADASDVGGELERFVYEIRRNHPENVID